MSELQLDEELGKGNYGTVKKVLHIPTNVYMAMKVSSSRAFVANRWGAACSIHFPPLFRKSALSLNKPSSMES